MWNIFANTADTDFAAIIFKLIISFALGVVVSAVYKKTHEGISYSKTFVTTLVLMSVLISMVMVVIGQSLAHAFTLLGAFTIIRFRTAIKDTRDIAFVFWALVTGMAVGTGNYGIAAAAAVIISLIIFILKKINFGSIKRYDHLLTFLLDTKIGGADSYRPLFAKYLKEDNLVNIVSREGSIMDFTFNIRLINMDDEVNFINELRNVAGVSHINFISSSKEAEY